MVNSELVQLAQGAFGSARFGRGVCGSRFEDYGSREVGRGRVQTGRRVDGKDGRVECLLS